MRQYDPGMSSIDSYWVQRPEYAEDGLAAVEDYLAIDPQIRPAHDYVQEMSGKARHEMGWAPWALPGGWKTPKPPPSTLAARCEPPTYDDANARRSYGAPTNVAYGQQLIRR